MTDTTLLVLAAGMGSRYGGLKQLDPMGPGGEPLLDYSVFDAQRAGFGRVVFVIRREKPWGTGHAIWSARGQVHTPFAAINADDFYGRDAYRTLAEFFARPSASGEPDAAEFAMVAYRLDRTLSEHGSVSRGVCVVDADDYLRTVEERTSIERVGADGGARYSLPGGSFAALTGHETVSLNCWGFTPAIFPLLEEGFARFLEANLNAPKAEYYIPSAVAEMITAGTARVRVLPTEATWFGVTYREDKPVVAESLAGLTRAGEYPPGLWRQGV